MELLTLADPAVRAMQTRLQTDMAAAIALVNAQPHVQTDGVDIVAPVEVLPYVQAFESQVAWPLVCIQRNRGKFEDDTGWAATLNGSLTILAFLQDADQDALTKRLDRYMQAIATCAMQDRTLGGQNGAPWALTLDLIDWGPTMGELPADSDVPNAFLSWAGLTVNFRSDQ